MTVRFRLDTGADYRAWLSRREDTRGLEWP
jgi:hypothetical protein